MGQLGKRTAYTDGIQMLLGTGCIALGIQWFYDPGGFVTGGFTGIGIIVRQMTCSLTDGGVPLWLTNLALNLPFFLAALRVKGRRFVAKTAAATFLLSGWLYVIPAVDMAQQDFLLASVFGGVISGVGMGLVLIARATTGGTDMVAVLIQKRLRHYSVVQILQMIDGAIVLLGIFLFGLKSGLYAMIAIFITSKASDALMEGMKYAKAAFIITERYDEVAKELMNRLNRGVTGLSARGMYSGVEKCMLYCVVSKKEIVALKEIVVGIDGHAFVIVSDVKEVLGEGFIEYEESRQAAR